MRLAQLQNAYRDFLLTGETATLAPAIVADAFDAAERLAIYRNNFLGSVTEALKANFPVTLRLLGAGFFEQAARRFVLAHPPQRPCLFEYGRAFPDYLRDLPQLAALPYVADMARFEFARIASYNAPAERTVSAEVLAPLSPEQLDLLPVRLASHVRLVSVASPALDLWTAHQQPGPDVANIDMTPRPHTLLVCRPDTLLVVEEIDASTAHFLKAAEPGATLGRAATQCGAADEAALSHIIAHTLALRLLTTS